MEKVDLGYLVELKSGKYLILSKAIYDGVLYVFTNKIKDNEEIGEENYIFKVENDRYFPVKDEELRKILTSIFEEKINKMLKEEGE